MIMTISIGVEGGALLKDLIAASRAFHSSAVTFHNLRSSVRSLALLLLLLPYHHSISPSTWVWVAADRQGEYT